MAFFPSDEEINNLGVRGIYIGNYVKWNGLSNYKLAKKFGFKTPKKNFKEHTGNTLILMIDMRMDFMIT